MFVGERAGPQSHVHWPWRCIHGLHCGPGREAGFMGASALRRGLTLRLAQAPLLVPRLPECQIQGSHIGQLAWSSRVQSRRAEGILWPFQEPPSYVFICLLATVTWVVIFIPPTNSLLNLILCAISQKAPWLLASKTAGPRFTLPSLTPVLFEPSLLPATHTRGMSPLFTQRQGADRPSAHLAPLQSYKPRPPGSSKGQAKGV